MSSRRCRADFDLAQARRNRTEAVGWMVFLLYLFEDFEKFFPAPHRNNALSPSLAGSSHSINAIISRLRQIMANIRFSQSNRNSHRNLNTSGIAKAERVGVWEVGTTSANPPAITN